MLTSSLSAGGFRREHWSQLKLTHVFAGYPLLTHFTEKKPNAQGGFNLGGINATGQIADFPGNYGLVDKDTPKEALTMKSYMDEEDLVLVFSDEFNQDDRTFYPGDDPFWEAVDLHYWGTVGSCIVFHEAALLTHYQRMIWSGMIPFKVQ